MSDFTNPGGFLDPFDGFDKPDISQGDANAADAYQGSFTWVVFPHGEDASPPGSAATAAQAKADAIAAGQAHDKYPFGWEVYDSGGKVVDSGSQTSQGSGDNGPPVDEPVKFRVNVTNDVGAAVWSSGYVYDTLEGAKAGLEEQRGSFEAGKTFKYAIYDHSGAVVDSGTVASTAYVPDDTNYFIRIHNELTNTDEPDDNTPYTTLEAAKAALSGIKSALKAKSPTQGKYDWWILKAGASVADGVFIWGFETPPTLPPGNLLDGIPQEAVMAVIIVIIVVAVIGVLVSVGGA